MMIAMIDSDQTNFGKQYFLTGRDRGSWICTDARQDGYSAAAGSMLQRLVANEEKTTLRRGFTIT